MEPATLVQCLWRSAAEHSINSKGCNSKDWESNWGFPVAAATHFEGGRNAKTLEYRALGSG